MVISGEFSLLLLPISFGAIGLLTIWLWRHPNHHIQSSGPTLLTTVGIFFCFLGIAFGLLNFDPVHIQDSIPQLISGIRLSFWSSVMGIGCALLIKWRLLSLVSKSHVDDHIEGATIDDLARLLSELKHSIAGTEESTLVGQTKLLRQDIGDLKLSIAGTEESTLIGQTKLLRQDINDRFDRLQKSHERFAETLAENNSKAFIQALQEAINSFNEKLTEQLGDNFKHLNQSVERMVLWQEQYKEQMAEMIQQQQICTTNMTEATRRYTEIVGYAEAFTSAASKLSDLLTGLETQRNTLESSLKSLGSLLIQASGSLPEIEKKIVDMTDQITSGIRANNAEINKTIADVRQSLQASYSEMNRLVFETIRSGGEELKGQLKQISEGVRANNAEVGSIINKTANSLETSHTEMKNLLSETVRSTNQELGNHVRQMSEQTREKVEALDKALSEELTKSLTSLGTALTTLSGKFVEDYTPLTDKLNEVLDVARGVSVTV